MIHYILSDIHEDFYALQKVINEISKDKNHWAIYTLGDTVGYSIHYEPNQDKRNANKCINLLKSNNADSVLGNHDLNFLKRRPKLPFFIYPQEWNKLSVNERIDYKSVWLYLDELSTELNEDNLYYLENSQDYLLKENLFFSHFLYPDLNGNLIVRKELINKLLPVHFIFMQINKVKISFVGHLHTMCPVIFSSKNEKKELKEGESIFLDTKDNIFTVFCPPTNTYKSDKLRFISYCDISGILKYHVEEDTIEA